MNTNLTNLLTSPVETLNSSAIVDVELDISPSNENSMTLVCDEKYLKQIKVSLSNGSLRIGAEGNFNNPGIIKLILKTSSLEEITVSGASDVSGVYKGNNLKIKVSGTGDVNLSGQVQNLDVNISGTGDASLKGLEAQNVTLKLSGTSDAKVFASKSCFVTISGIGDATIYGSPEKIQKKVSGLGSVKEAGGKKKKESTHEMPMFSANIANIFEESFSGGMFKSLKDIEKEKAEIQRKRYELQKQKEEMNSEINLKRMELEMQRKMQELKNSYFNNPEITKAPKKVEPEQPVEPPLSTSQRLKNKFKGLL